MKRRQHEYDVDASRLHLRDECREDLRSRCGRRGVADIGEEPARDGHDARVGVRATRGDPVPEQRFVIALARGESADPLLEEFTLPVGRPDGSERSVEALLKVDGRAERLELGR